MRKLLISSMVVIFSCFYFAVVVAHEPPNIVLLKQQITRYYHSGEYSHDVGKVIARAEKYLKQRIKKDDPTKHKLALVFDVDDTAISNYPAIKASNFGWTLQQSIASNVKSKHPVIPQTLKLYNFAKKNHVAVFFITARVPDQKACTEKNLKQAGYKNWNGLYLETLAQHKKYKSEIPFKSMIRKQLIAQGYDIVENIGDQYSDLGGGYADRTYKLPNPCVFSK